MENTETLREWFERVDSEKTSSITALQLKSAFAVGNLEFSLSVVQQMIRMYDFDRNGTMSFEGAKCLFSPGELIAIVPFGHLFFSYIIHSKSWSISWHSYSSICAGWFEDLYNIWGRSPCLGCWACMVGCKRLKKIINRSSEIALMVSCVFLTRQELSYFCYLLWQSFLLI
ncbi:uncharacterized protein LOC131237040 isoform X6 [Magnolia sinica]|uniref:uncharacterized protein LOC131237040 isoform X6 n=1 Tax=Magnolia sinica TaxID=86752 RepID=UPI002659692F|nr:uncharacterized protein LOC131237040 isoform X6 [Magnolia sinica]